MTARKPVRLWPAVVIVILQLLLRFVAPRVNPDFMVYGLFAGPVAGLAIVLWWLLLSRAPWSERLGAVALMIAALFATSRLVDRSIATGAMGVCSPCWRSRSWASLSLSGPS